MLSICEMCKLLYNPLRMEILLRVYSSKDGLNVGLLANEMQFAGLGVSGVSQYMKQLERIGVIRRERAGRYVNYLADASRATSKVQSAIEVLVRAAKDGSLGEIKPIFGALMNPFRARVIAAVAKAGSITAFEICEKTNHQMKYLKRDLQEAVDAGILEISDDEPTVAAYKYIEPPSPLARTLVSLLS